MAEQQAPDQQAPDQQPDPQPTDIVRLDGRTLRGLAHPIRLRMIGMLRLDGPSTATKLAERLGLSSAATSYHLRQLAAYGFIVPAEDLGAGRERYWRAAHRMTQFSIEPADDPEVAADSDTYLRSIAEIYAGNVANYFDERSSFPPEWQNAGTLSDQVLMLTVEETRQLVAAMWEIVEQRPRAGDTEAQTSPGARRVSVQLQVFPRAERRS